MRTTVIFSLDNAMQKQARCKPGIFTLHGSKMGLNRMSRRKQCNTSMRQQLHLASMKKLQVLIIHHLKQIQESSTEIVSTLTVGCESWKSTKGTDRHLKAFEIKCLREIVGIKWNEFITNTQIRWGVEQDLIS